MFLVSADEKNTHAVLPFTQRWLFLYVFFFLKMPPLIQFFSHQSRKLLYFCALMFYSASSETSSSPAFDLFCFFTIDNKLNYCYH